MSTQTPTLPNPSPSTTQPLPVIAALPRTCPLCGEVDCEAISSGACAATAETMDRLDRDGGWQ